MSREKFLPIFPRLENVASSQLAKDGLYGQATRHEIARGEDQMKEAERALSARVHDALAGVLRSVGTAFSHLPRALRVSALSAMLLHAESVMAQSFAEQIPEKLTLLSEGEGLSDAAKQELAKLRTQRVDIQISTMNSRGYIQGFSLEHSFDQHSLVVADDTPAFFFSRQVSHTDLLDQIDTSFHFQKKIEDRDETGRLSRLTIITKDKFNNNLFIYRSLNSDGISYTEKISVFPARVYTEVRENIPFRIDTSFIKDFPNVNELFWVTSYPTVLTIDDLHVVNDYQGGLSDKEIEELILPYVDDIRGGLHSIQEQFSLNEPIINRISVGGANMSRQAFAAPDYFSMGLGFFVKNPALEAGKMKEDIGLVIKHETFHVLDNKFKISESEEFNDFFHGTPRHILDSFSEHKFDFEEHTVNEGHAADSPTELFASVMNGLDDPHWERRVDSLSPEERKAYREILEIIQKLLLEHSDLEKDAPIHGQLRDRLAHFT